jgi:hypothetical protein
MFPAKAQRRQGKQEDETDLLCVFASLRLCAFAGKLNIEETTWQIEQQ